jgi:hypothetical protein
MSNFNDSSGNDFRMFAVISYTESNKYIIIDYIKNILQMDYAVYKDLILFVSDKSQNDLTREIDNSLINKIDFILISAEFITGRADENINAFVKRYKKIDIIEAEEKRSGSGQIIL